MGSVMSKGDGGASQDATIARLQEQQRQERIRQGTEAINSTFNSQFNDDFFNKQGQSYLDYALPTLNDQYANTQKELAFSLARSGLTDSSTRAAKEAELSKVFDTNKQGIYDKAAEYASNARSSIEGARSDLIQTLNTTGDATGAINSALARAAALSQPPAYSPLGQMFGDFSSTLSQAAAQAKSNAYGGSGGSSGANIYTPPKNSTAVL